jgi:L-threonylcarbamoyladenylate synthase
MEVIRLKEQNLKQASVRAADVLRTGGVVLYPTDTLYGLGADALSNEAVAKVYAIKGRREVKPTHCIVADIEMAERYGEVGDITRKLARELPRGKVTLVIPKKRGLDSGICRGISTFGFRIPDNDVCWALLEHFGKPITATSANKSDEAPERDVAKILAQLGDTAEEIGVALDAGTLPASKPSTVVDLTSSELVILREGAIPSSDIWEIVRHEY